jgi:membrane peptidoglycan carboxypeptidase
MTRWRKASALAGGVIVVVAAAFGAYKYLSNSPATPAGPATAHPQDTTVYYSDGKTVLGTFGAAGPQHRNNSDPWVPYLMTQVDNELTGIDGVSQQQIQAGGLKVVTAVSRSMEVELYKAVSENLSPASISAAPGATVKSLPSWALVGAELQDPKNGEVLAEYPGRGQSLPAAQCGAVCDVNTAAYSREQVGSSFMPYVLATAVSQGMNVKTSTLNANRELCVPPDTEGTTLSTVVPYGTTKCAQADQFAVSNAGGAVIGDPAPGGGTTVQDAMAQSSPTAFVDLTHRVGTQNIERMAGQLGVNVAAYAQGGSGLVNYTGQIGMGLGVAPLTVNEQATMLSTFADNGQYHRAHVIKYWQRSASGARQLPKVDQHAALTPQQAVDVQYAMETTTAKGTAAQTVTFGQQHPGTVIGAIGTTVNSHSGSFLGATTQYSLVVGMFTANPMDPDKLAELGGSGSASYWPAKIWNTFAEAEFATTPTLFPTNPSSAGQAWNQVG